MKKKLFYFFMTTVLFSCTQGSKPNGDNNDPQKTVRDSLLKNITSIEDKINTTMKTGALDQGLAASAVNAYESFVKRFPKDSSAPYFLFKAADLYSSAMKRYEESVTDLDRITRDYPDFKKLPLCYFELGVIYDDNINDDVKAKVFYEEFLKRYPNHQLAPQVKSLISYLGRSNEDLLKEFEKKNAK